mgnify:FL=1
MYNYTLSKAYEIANMVVAVAAFECYKELIAIHLAELFPDKGENYRIAMKILEALKEED